jgi:hypothetical protein
LAALDRIIAMHRDVLRRALDAVEWWVPVRVIIVLFVIAVVLRLLGV